MWNLDQISPVAFRIGPKLIYWYGVFVAVGFVVGIAVAGRLLRREGLPAAAAGDIGVWALVGGMLGGRLLYVLTEWDYYVRNPLEIPRIDHGGLVYLGGLAGGILGIYLYVRRQSLSAWPVLDAFSPALALGHAFGRVGCLLRGCCYGTPTRLPWGVWLGGELRHPTPLYAAAMNALLALALVGFYRHRRFPGQVFVFYLLAYGTGRFLTDFLRGDFPSRPIMGWMATSQLMSLTVVMAGALLWRARTRAVRREPGPLPTTD